MNQTNSTIVMLLLLLIGACGGRETEQDTAHDWVHIDGGCFQMGEDQVYQEEQPVHQACVDPFYIASTEVTVAQFRIFVTATNYKTRAERGWSADEAGGPGIDLLPASSVFTPPQEMGLRDLNWWQLVEGANWEYPSGPSQTEPAPANHPVTHVTRADAQAYANWIGGRLPTEAEWEIAARGGLDGTLMAWPDAEKAALTSKANTWQGVFPVANTAGDGFIGVAPVASFPANDFGLHDMIGNVWEWTATPYSPSHAARDKDRTGMDGLDPAQPGVPVGTIKGGSYLCAKSYCYRFRPAARQAQDLAFGTSHIGFRIVKDASSATETER